MACRGKTFITKQGITVQSVPKVTEQFLKQVFFKHLFPNTFDLNGIFTEDKNSKKFMITVFTYLAEMSFVSSDR